MVAHFACCWHALTKSKSHMLYQKLSNSYNLTTQRKQQPNCVWPRQNLPSTMRYCRLRYLWHVTRIGLMASFAKVWAHVFLQKARGTVPMLKTNVDRTGGIWKPLFSKSALFPGTQFLKLCAASATAYHPTSDLTGTIRINFFWWCHVLFLNLSNQRNRFCLILESWMTCSLWRLI